MATITCGYNALKTSCSRAGGGGGAGEAKGAPEKNSQMYDTFFRKH